MNREASTAEADETGMRPSMAERVGDHGDGRTHPISLWTGMAIWLVGVALSAVGVVLLGVNSQALAVHPAVPVFTTWLTSGLPYLIVGGLIVARRPANSIGWLLSLGGLAGVVSFAAEQYAVYALLTNPQGQLLAPEAAWLAYWLWVLWVAFYPFFILLYPDGKPPSPRWRWVVWLDCSILIVLCVPTMVGTWSVRSTYLFDPTVLPSWALDAFNATFAPLVTVSLLISFAAAVSRYRSARSIERAQIRWIIYGTAVLIASSVLAGSLLANTPLRDDATALISSTTLGFLVLPVCIGIAIFRYHLFDIDRLINRTIVYGLLTAALAGLYVGGVALLQSLLRSLTGGGSDLAIVATTLLIAAIFLPLRRWIQGFIDRRFYRRKYDATRTLEVFSATLRDEVDLDTLTARLLQVVEETMQPAHESLWLRSTAAERVRDE